MRYLLNEQFHLRSWKDRLGGVYDALNHRVIFPGKEVFLLLMKCDGAHEFDLKSLTEKEKESLDSLIRENVIREAPFFRFIKPEQRHKIYPAEYKESVHWSITGACNLKCRHCFMSAPNAKHGAPTHDQIIRIADSLAECGIFKVELTGGEPLIRSDFFDIVSTISERGIGISTIYTNGWLVDENLLDELVKCGQHPSFQLSYDGIGWHDFLRGIEGAEEKTLEALKLLQERGFDTSISMCIHRKNKETLRDSVNLLASLGVKSVKIGPMMQLGEWANPEVADLQLTNRETLELIEEYIPQYFEDNAPTSVVLSGAFRYTVGDDKWYNFYRRECVEEKEKTALSCKVLAEHFYIGADGMVAPCMGMCDCKFAENLPNLFTTPLKEIIGPGSDFNRLCHTTVGEVRDRNDKCRNCKFIDRCAGGCRNAALIQSDNYYAPDEENCYFFENGWEERITEAAGESFKEYLKRSRLQEDKAE